MDAYKLMAKLRKARRSNTISAGAQALFYELMAICNEEGWSDVFKCRNQELMGNINVAEKTLIAYRAKLADAGLIMYISGQANHEPCMYSLNGCLNNYPNGLLNGSKNYSSTVSRSVENVTDLYKTKSKSKSNTKTFVVEEAETLARKNEIDEAIDGYCSPIEMSEEKEKNVAPKKERTLPALEEVMIKVTETAMWRNVLEHKLIPDDLKPKWDKLTGIDKEIYVQEREDLFREFYEVKEDTYLVSGLPTWAKMAENFYYWVGIRKNIALTNLKGILNGSKPKPNSIPKNGTAGDRNARNQSITDVVNGSAAFLQQYSGIDHS